MSHLAVLLALLFSLTLSPLEQAERRIANAPVKYACAMRATGQWLGCLKGTRFGAAPPGTDDELIGATITSNEVYPFVPFPQWEDVLQAKRHGWAYLRQVQGKVLRIVRLSPGMSFPTFAEYTAALTTAFRRFHVGYRVGAVSTFEVWGDYSAILAAGDSAWVQLAASNGFTYIQGTVK